jgi:ATP-dependent Clp protease, protease subunit
VNRPTTTSTAHAPESRLLRTLRGLLGGADDTLDRTLYITDGIDSDLATAFDRLMRGLATDPNPITLVFNTPGGYVTDGLAMFDCITRTREQGIPVYGLVQGTAYSMGAIVLQACEVRAMTPHSSMLIHEASDDHAGRLSEIELSTAWTRRLSKQTDSILLSRSTLDPETLKEKTAAGDWYLTAAEARRHKLIDRII